MGKFFDSISDDLANWIREQPMFFVGSAPLSAEGHVNLSPKGLDSFRILTPNQVVYLDLTGSGNETSAHLHENARITIMFCAFKGAPRILRLYGKGRVILPDNPEWDELIALFPAIVGTRQLVVTDVHAVQTSCGYAVPLMDFVDQRDTLIKWAEHKGDDGLSAYWDEKNSLSIDKLPTPLNLSRH
jgi:hypothetical protein